MDYGLFLHLPDQIEIDVEDERIFLNREEFKLPFIDAAFTEMIRNGGIY